MIVVSDRQIMEKLNLYREETGLIAGRYAWMPVSSTGMTAGACSVTRNQSLSPGGRGMRRLCEARS